MDALTSTAPKVTRTAPAVRSEVNPEPQGGKNLPPTGNSAPEAPPVVDLQGAVKQIETYLSSSQRSLQFRLDDVSGKPVMTVMNPQTGEVIRQIPGDEVLQMAAAIRKGGAHLIDTLV